MGSPPLVPSSLAARSPRMQRVDGALRLAYRRDRDGRTRLADLFQRAPCRVLFPQVESGELPQAVLLTTSGGLTGGDRLRIDLEIGACAAATITTQAAEKLYRAPDDEAPTQIDIHLRAGENAWAEWLAQETILFERARLRRLFVADLAPGARLLAVESLVFGRSAMGEDCRHGLLHDAWRIRRDGRLLWADALHLDGAIGAQRDRPFGFAAARSLATLLYAGPDAPARIALVRERLAALPATVTAAATLIQDLLIVRVLAGEAASLRAAVIDLAAVLRAAAGLPACLPRVWHC